MQNVGKYQIVEKIGVGGFGEVYRGRDPFIKRPVAIKTCSSDDEEIRNRFYQEAEIAGNLHHRNITTVYDFGVQDGLPYLIQEYLSGEDLDRKVKRRDPLPYPEKLYYLLQIARGLAYAHSAGVIHRDIKPANIRILEDGTAKIMDFGIAKLAQSQTGLTQTGMTLGTAAYLAPEQIRGDPVDHHTDLFSFGVLAYELLTYERPFQGEQISAVLYQILHQEPTPIRDHWAEAPPDIVRLIERCLSKDPAGRHENGAELLRELELIQRKGRQARNAVAGEAGGETRVMAGPRPAERGEAAPSPPGGTPPIDPRHTRPAVSVQPVEVTPTPSRGIDDLELSAVRQQGLEGGRHGTEPKVAVPGGLAGPRTTLRKPGSPPPFLHTAALLGGLAIVALGFGLWMGRPEERPPASVDRPEAAEPEKAAGDDPAPAPGTERSKSPPPAVEPPPAATPDPTEDVRPQVGTPPETVPEPVETPPEPPGPQPGTVTVEAVSWAASMTIEVEGQPARPLNRRRQFTLDPGTYTVVCDLRTEDYSARRSFQVNVGEAEQKSIACTIPKPGVLKVVARLGRAQGDVAVDGRTYGKSPVEGRLAPGEHQVLVQPLAGKEGSPISKIVTLISGESTLLSFDLSTGEATIKGSGAS